MANDKVKKDSPPTLQHMLAQERRGRLAAERLLEQRQKELSRANKRLGEHAMALSDQILVKRQEVQTFRSKAEQLQDENQQARQELERANRQAVVAERRLWDALETIQDGFAVFNRKDQLVIANGAYLAMFDGLDGIRPGISYAQLLQLIADEGLVDIGEMRGDEWIALMLERWTAEDIEPVTLRLWNDSYVKLMDRRAEDGDLVSLALDITDTIRHEAELEDARQRAESAARAKAAFLANMSHEIRTPMNGVVGMAEMLLETALSDEQRLYASTIKNSGEALLVIINDVLDYSKIEAEKLVLHPEPFDLERSVHEVLVLLQPAATDKRLSLLVDYDMFLPTRFIADPGRLRQILTNLVGNAVKFTHSGHVLVRVTGYEEEPLPERGPRYRLHVTVEDTGIGIPAEKLDMIFGEFNQVESATNRSFEGTGLGLAITRQLVEMMGGEIWVDSVVGEGSCFGFQLCLESDGNADPINIPDMLRTALIIDDLPINRMILEKQLSTMGLRVSTQRSAGAALAEDPGRFDVVLFDAEMPEMNAADFVARLRAGGSNAAVLLLATNPGQSTRLDPPDDRVAVLQKPILRRDLFNRLREAGAGSIGPAAPPPKPRMRVLAAEDNQTNRLVFSKMIRHLDLELSFACDGQEAVEKFRDLRPHLIFMDISMPRMDGKQATRAIRSLETQTGAPRVPICALTAHAMEGDDADILKHGLDHYLTKPLRKAEIEAMVRAHCPEGVSLDPAPLPASA